jgi:predicted dehydrogenase
MAKRKGAIIGYGFISERGHAPAWRASSEFEIVAVADVCSARRAIARSAFPDARIYGDYASLLAHEAQNLDFVDVTTPPYMHAPIALAALDAGLHVFCEKPLATRPQEALAMLRSAERHRRVIMPVMNYKHAPVIKAVRRALDAGAIGRVHQVTLTTFRSTHARGVAEWNPDWRRQRQYSGGGIAMDHGSHTFYLAFDWLGAYPTSISARMSTVGGEDTEDTFSATMVFPTGLAIAHLTWTAGVRKVIYTMHGERGAIRVEDDDVEISVAHPGTNGNGRPAWTTTREHISSDWMDASHVQWFESVLDQFASAIESHEHVGKDAVDALQCVELINAAYASARDGCRELRLGKAEPDDRPLELH